MNCILAYDKKGRRDARAAWIPDLNDAQAFAEGMEKAGWSVVWTVHSTDRVVPMSGYELNLAEWRKHVDDG